MDSKKLRDNQVFIRNLSYDVKKEDIMKLFEEFGPIKHVSVAESRSKDSNEPARNSRGFGFVTFALAEDATAAMTSLQGKDFKGRNLKLELAVRKAIKSKKDKNNLTELEDPIAVLAQKATVPIIKEENEGSRHDDDGESEEEVEPNSSVETRFGEAQDEKTSKTAGLSRALQLVVMGIPEDIDKNSFKRVLSKTCRKASVELLKQDNPLSESLTIVYPAGRIMIITAPSRKDVAKIFSQLNNATVHNLGLREIKTKVKINSKKKSKITKTSEESQTEEIDETSEKSDNGNAKLVVRILSDVTDITLRKQKCRVIIRNLSFQATEENIATKLSKFGPLLEVSIPYVTVKVPVRGSNTGGGGAFNKNDRNNQNGKNNKFDKTSEGKNNKNGKNSTVGKEVEEEVFQEKVKSRGFAFVSYLCAKDAAEAVAGAAGLRVCNREVAVDWSLSKHSYGLGQADLEAGEGVDDDAKEEEEEKEEVKVVASKTSAIAVDAEVVDAEEDEGNVDDDVADDMDDLNDDDMDSLSEHEDGDDGEEDMEDDGEDDDGSKASEDDNDDDEEEDEDDVQQGCTVFIRDIPFDAEPRDLNKAFQSFGKISMAVIVKDRETAMSKGSAFIKFSTSAEAIAAVNAATSTRGVFVKDRLARVDIAVEREKAQLLKSKEKVAKDKRNLYLANEGLVALTASTSSASESTDGKALMSNEDREKRERAQTEKKKKLQNPLYFVSPTRLSVRNLSKDVNDTVLRNLCFRAAKAGLEKSLVSAADIDAHLCATGAKLVDRTQQSLIIPKLISASVTKAKVMLDLNRTKAGLPVSRGYGFVDFSHHAHALSCLRELNNNRQYNKESASSQSRLLVDFSLENMRKVMLIQERALRAQSLRPPPTEASIVPSANKAANAAATTGKDANKNAKKKPVNDPPTKDSLIASQDKNIQREGRDDGGNGGKKRKLEEKEENEVSSANDEVKPSKKLAKKLKNKDKKKARKEAKTSTINSNSNISSKSQDSNKSVAVEKEVSPKEVSTKDRKRNRSTSEDEGRSGGSKKNTGTVTSSSPRPNKKKAKTQAQKRRA